MKPRERVRPAERKPLAEAADPLALERCYAKEPEAWTDETLRTAVELQRREREGRLAAKARRRIKERKTAECLSGTPTSMISTSETLNTNDS